MCLGDERLRLGPVPAKLHLRLFLFQFSELTVDYLVHRDNYTSSRAAI